MKKIEVEELILHSTFPAEELPSLISSPLFIFPRTFPAEEFTSLSSSDLFRLATVELPLFIFVPSNFIDKITPYNLIINFYITA